MLRYAKLGNIKIGGSQNGLPQRYNKIFVTKAYKDSGENFVIHPKFLNGVDELKVRLPFVMDLINTFDASPANFATICGYRYIIKGLRNAQVVALPLQEKDMNDRLLPCINFGPLNEMSFARFELMNRSLLTLFVMNEDGTDYLDGKNGVYLFKTISKNTFYDTDNTLRLLSGMDANLLRLVNFTLELHTKVIKNAQGEGEEISYARLLPPTPNEMVKASELLRTSGHILIPALAKMEEEIVNSRTLAIQSALNEGEACVFFGCDRLEINVETQAFDQPVSVSEKAKEERAKKKPGSSKKGKGVAEMIIEAKEKTPKDNMIETQTKELSARFPKIKDTVIASLINNFGVDEAVAILEANPTLPQVIAEISKRSIPDTENISDQ